MTKYFSLCVSLSLNLLLKTCKFSIKCHHLNALLLLFLACRYRRKSNESKRYIASNFHYILSMTKKERQPTLLFWESKKSKIAYVPHCENSDSTQILMDIFISVSDKLWPVWTKQKKMMKNKTISTIKTTKWQFNILFTNWLQHFISFKRLNNKTT